MISFDENDLFKNGRGEEDDTVSLTTVEFFKIIENRKAALGNGTFFFLICVSCWCNINLETNSLN